MKPPYKDTEESTTLLFVKFIVDDHEYNITKNSRYT